MNRIGDPDLELLEACLDGELSPHQAEVVRRRLAAEPDLADALRLINRQREFRQVVWRESEPPDPDADAFARRLVQSTGRRERWRRWRTSCGFAAAAAACFAVGWICKGLASHDHEPSPDQAGTNLADGAMDTLNRRTGAFQVVLMDEAGNVLAVQKFSQPDEARQFANDLTRWQLQQQQVRDGEMLLISDQF